MYSRYKADDLIMNTVYGYKLFLSLDELEHASDMYFHKIITENTESNRVFVSLFIAHAWNTSGRFLRSIELNRII